MTSTTERAARLSPPLVSGRTLGLVLCLAGFALLWSPPLVGAALGAELLALAFWCWARVAPDAELQTPRWEWLRRPAAALWLAAALEALTLYGHGPLLGAAGVPRFLAVLEACAVTWAGLELLAALPLARPYSDLPGPLLTVRPWLPVLMPAAGFAILWRHAPHGAPVDPIRGPMLALLVLTAALGALRAFARRQWTASLRWLAVADSSLAAVLVTRGTLPASASLLLWLGACGGHALLLAGELRGAATRRGPVTTRLWRVAAWTAATSLAWPTLIALATWHSRMATWLAIGAALPVVLTAWITVVRLRQAPERRRVMRPRSPLTWSHVASLLVLIAGPAALVGAWWGAPPPLGISLLALAPSAAGGLAAILSRQWRRSAGWQAVRRAGETAPGAAGRTYRVVVEFERRVIGVLAAAGRAITEPLHDLHTGDAQEYLLFLIGVGVLALVLPLLQ